MRCQDSGRYQPRHDFHEVIKILHPRGTEKDFSVPRFFAKFRFIFVLLSNTAVLPITSGDTALRGLRLTVAESLKIDQSTNSKRLTLSAIIFALVAAILVFAKTNANGFNILWRYFAWSNQTLSLFAFLAIAVWMFENGKSKYVWIPLIPGGFYAFITVTYIVNAKIGFGMPWGIAYAAGAIACVAYVIAILWYGKKRAAAKNK